MIQKFRLAEPKMKDDGMKPRAKELVKENKELTLLKAINCILELAEDSELSKVFWEASHVFTDYVAERMKISPVQSVLMSLFIESGSTGHSASIANIARYTSCRNVKIMQYQQEVDDLVKRGFVRLSQKNYHQEKIYVIPSALLDALNRNEAHEKRVAVCSNVIELFQNFFELTHLRYEEELSTELLMEEVEDLIEQNKGLPFVRALLDMHIDLDDEMIIMHLCRHLVLDNEDSIDIDRISYLFDDKRERYNFRRLMFERRFLYKVKFEKPDCEQRAHIWHSMMPHLDRGITTALASHYDFSGGQIENIARKYHVDCILYGKKAIGQETLEKYCQEECLAQQTTRIGFVK